MRGLGQFDGPLILFTSRSIEIFLARIVPTQDGSCNGLHNDRGMLLKWSTITIHQCSVCKCNYIFYIFAKKKNYILYICIMIEDQVWKQIFWGRGIITFISYNNNITPLQQRGSVVNLGIYLFQRMLIPSSHGEIERRERPEVGRDT